MIQSELHSVDPYASAYHTLRLTGDEVIGLLQENGVAFLATRIRSALQTNGCVIVRVSPSVDIRHSSSLFHLLATNIGPIAKDAHGAAVQRITLADTRVSNRLSRRLSLADRPYQDMPLHTDGVFLDAPPDWVGLMKTEDHDAKGGHSLCLRLDDWSDMDEFAASPLATLPIAWRMPASNRAHIASCSVVAPIFSFADQRSTIRFAKHCISEQSLHQFSGLREYVDELDRSLMGSLGVYEFNLGIGDMYFVNNRRVLHGRRSFVPHPQLTRSVIRISGVFPVTPSDSHPRR